jgi:hypothetical protein
MSKGPRFGKIEVSPHMNETPVVAVVQVDDAAHERTIERALAGRVTVEWCTGSTRFLGCASKVVDAGILVWVVRGRILSAERALVDLRSRLPHLPLILFLNAGVNPTWRESALNLAARIEAAIAVSPDDLPAVIHQTVQTARRQSASGRLLAALGGDSARWTPVCSEFVVHCARLGAEESALDDVARTLGVSLRTIERQVALSGLDHPREILGCILAYRAAFLLRDPHRTSEQVAKLLPIQGHGTIATLLRRHLGIGVRECRRVDRVAEILARMPGLLRAPRPRSSADS